MPAILKRTRRPCSLFASSLGCCQTIASPLSSIGSEYVRPEATAGTSCASATSAARTRFYREGERAERRELILHEAASHLGINKMTVIRLIRDGILPGRQICAGAPYVIREEDFDRPAVRRAIRNGRAVSPDARQGNLSFQ
jgi:excisionase family DNA binding protein